MPRLEAIPASPKGPVQSFGLRYWDFHFNKDQYESNMSGNRRCGVCTITSKNKWPSSHCMVISNMMMASIRTVSHFDLNTEGLQRVYYMLKLYTARLLHSTSLTLPFIPDTDGSLFTIFVDSTADASVALPSTSLTAGTAVPFRA